MASNQLMVSEAATLNHDPDTDEWGRVVRIAGVVHFVEALELLQRRFDLDDVLVFYIGYAERGVLDNQPLWTIKRINFNASGNPTILQWATTAIWNDRTTTIYT